jgi:hypothetical protein
MREYLQAGQEESRKSAAYYFALYKWTPAEKEAAKLIHNTWKQQDTSIKSRW